MAINTKWPELRVKGKNVTTEQAEEIIVRTEYWPLSCNDHAFTDAANKIFGFVDPMPRGIDMETMQALFRHNQNLKRRLKVLDISYLHNPQIVSAWIFGTHGWCQWDGRIECSGFNVGKWPNTKDITKELLDIAKAFPFLEMTVQTMSGENCEPGTVVTDQWQVKGGEVTHDFDNDMNQVPPAALDVRGYNVKPEDMAAVFNHRREHLISLAKLEEIAHRMLE